MILDLKISFRKSKSQLGKYDTARWVLQVSLWQKRRKDVDKIFR
jgi:hypothetical protein